MDDWPVARQHGVDQIMPRALVAEVDFQAIVEEGEEVASSLSLAPSLDVLN